MSIINDENDKATNRQVDNMSELADVEVEVGNTSAFNLDDYPRIINNLCSSFDEQFREMMVLSTLTVISSILPNVYGIYAQEKVYPNLYLYILGKAGSGKGNIIWTKRLLSSIEAYKPLDGNSNSLLQQVIDSRGQVVIPQTKILIPANNSSAGFMKILNDRDGKGLIFESEGDTIANSFKSDYGNYSDVLRKAFHHEAVSQYRKTEDVYISLDEPKLSVVISSTPNQLKRIISNAENGLFSRFMYHITEPIDEFLDVFETKKTNRNELFKEGADFLLNLYLKLLSFEDVRFSFTEEQGKAFRAFFNSNKSILVNLCHGDLDGTVNRMGIITFRLAMVLSVLRNSDSLGDGVLYCDDVDFKIALELASKLLFTASEVMKILPSQAEDSISESQMSLVQTLPANFTTAEAKKMGANLGLSERTVDRFLSSAVFVKVGHGKYRKADLN